MLSTVLKSLLITASVLLLAACAAGEDKINPETYQPAETDWTINDVTLTCSNPAMCPDNQGIIMAVTRTTSYTYWGSETLLTVSRCTGTIYDAHHVLTAGHCVDGFSKANEIWFKTVEKPGRPSRVFHVASTPAAREWEGRDFWRTDYASISLTEDASGIEYAHPALTAPGIANQMVALVINSATASASEMKRFQLDAKVCNHGVTSKNPITYDINPTKYMITGCRIIRGNSGGSVVEPTNLLSVLGIVSASNGPAPEDAYRIPFSSGIEGQEFEYGIITNARCVEAPGWQKTSATCKEMSNDIRENAVKAALAKTKPIVETPKTPNSNPDVPGAPGLIEQGKKLARAWFASPNSSAMFDAAKIEFLPELTPLRYARPGTLKFQDGFSIVPIPMCVSGDIPKGASRHLFLKIGAYQMNADGSSNTISPTLDTEVSVNLRSLGEGRYKFDYLGAVDIGSEYFFSLNPKDSSRYRKLKETGDVVVLSKCTGTEQRAYLDSVPFAKE